MFPQEYLYSAVADNMEQWLSLQNIDTGELGAVVQNLVGNSPKPLLSWDTWLLR
jgi:hypothetical protein